MTLILDEHFTGTTLSNIWEKYDGPDYGAPGEDPADSYFLPRNLVINTTGTHYLSLMIKREKAPDGIGNYTGAGLETIPVQYQITNGRMEIKARFPPGNQGLIGYALAWPANQDWPPEIDFAETTGSDTNLITFTQYGDNGDTYEESKTLDITQWHTYALDIDTINKKLVWWIDGQIVATQTQRFNTRKWIFGAGTWTCKCTTPPQYCGCPNNAQLPASMDIEYIKIWDSIPTPTPPVPPVLTSIEISPTNVSLQVSSEKQLTSICKDQNNNTIQCPILTWTSSNNSVATVESGLIKAISTGTINITATTSNITSNTSIVTVTSTPPSPQKTYTIVSGRLVTRDRTIDVKGGTITLREI